MKKTLIALAALGAMAGAAHAQSTVTLYGLLDANFGSYKSNQAVTVVPAVGPAFSTIQNVTQTKIDSGGLNGSRWGLRVSEDIGGGMAVIGNLESGVNLDTGSSGQGGLLFGRRANVGLSGGFGKVEIGRNSSSYDDVAGDHAMMEATIFDPSNTNNGNSAATAAAALGGNVGAIANFLNRNTTWVGYNTRFNNSVKYTSPNFSGFSGSVMYAFGEDKTVGVGATPGIDATKTVSASLKYANGPLLISGGYQSEGVGGSTSVGGGAVTPAAGGATPGTKPALQNTLLSVSYDFGVAKVGAGFNRAKYKDVTVPANLFAAGTPAHELARQNEWNLSVAVPLGATTISAGYAQSKGDDLGKSTGYGIQALYSLSKRTTLYAGAQSTKAYDNLAAAVQAASPTSSIGRITTYAAGIRHRF